MSATQATAEGALISATGLCVRFQGAAVLDDVSISLQRGEIVSLIGPNGSGKTTLVRALLGLQATSSGRIITGGLARLNLHTCSSSAEANSLPLRRDIGEAHPAAA